LHRGETGRHNSRFRDWRAGVERDIECSGVDRRCRIESCLLQREGSDDSDKCQCEAHQFPGCAARVLGTPGSANGRRRNEWALNDEAMKNPGYMQLKKTHDAAMVNGSKNLCDAIFHEVQTAIDDVNMTYQNTSLVNS
jgi:hypothetical protein